MTQIAFTRLRVELGPTEPPWSVAPDYYRLLRSGVYDLLRTGQPDLAEYLHTFGFTQTEPVANEKNGTGPVSEDSLSPQENGPVPVFKLFCFSGLIGEGQIERRQLSFANQRVIWLFATAVSAIAEALLAGLENAGHLRIGQSSVPIARVEPLKRSQIDPGMTCRLLSPLVLSSPDPQARQRRYLLRGDDLTLIEARLRDNLLAKHRALFGRDPPLTGFQFEWADPLKTWPATRRPTRLVRLSGPDQPLVRARGSLGGVRLSGSPDLLRIALHCGLGQHNASGMGFVLPEHESHLLRS